MIFVKIIFNTENFTNFVFGLHSEEGFDKDGYDRDRFDRNGRDEFGRDEEDYWK